MACWLFHRWSKWGQPYDRQGKWYQVRRCHGCGKMSTRRIRSYGIDAEFTPEDRAKGDRQGQELILSWQENQRLLADVAAHKQEP